MAAEQRVIAGRYRLLGRLGCGSTGEVFRAADMANGEGPVALKLLYPHYARKEINRSRFQREVEVVRALENPHIVAVTETGWDTPSETLFIVMELLEGETFAQLLDQRPRHRRRVLLRYVVHALEGLRAAHLARVVHRDIKPENIFIDVRSNPPRARLIDFGAREARRGHEQLDRDRDGARHADVHGPRASDPRARRDVQCRRLGRGGPVVPCRCWRGPFWGRRTLRGAAEEHHPARPAAPGGPRPDGSAHRRMSVERTDPPTPDRGRAARDVAAGARRPRALDVARRAVRSADAREGPTASLVSGEAVAGVQELPPAAAVVEVTTEPSRHRFGVAVPVALAL
ncbi:MAG: serine/threonine protein kinase, partial [Myxococcales bacterium]|nr:serine/threonine protein kinase [Myxococcales bacterium]